MKKILVVILFVFLNVLYCGQRPSLPAETEPLFVIQKGGKFGFIDRTGKLIIQPIYDNARDYCEGYAAVCIGAKPDTYRYSLRGGKWGFIDKLGKIIIDIQYDYVINYSGGYAAVNIGGNTEYFNPEYTSIGGKWGFIDKKGKFIIKPDNYGEVRSFSHSLVAIKVRNKWGYFDSMFNTVILPQYLRANVFYEQLALVSPGEKWGYIDRKGKYIIKPQFISAGNFHEGLAWIKQEGKYSYNPSGGCLRSGWHEYGHKYGFIDKYSNIVIDSIYDGADDFSEGKAPVKINGKWGYIYKNGKYFIAPQYEEARKYSEGFAAVKINNEWGFIDSKGYFAVTPRYKNNYTYVNDFRGGLSRIDSARMWAYIDTTGKYIWPFTK